MPIHEYEVRLFLEIEGDEADPDAIEDALTDLIDEEIEKHSVPSSNRCGLRFYDVYDMTVKKT